MPKSMLAELYSALVAVQLYSELFPWVLLRKFMKKMAIQSIILIGHSLTMNQNKMPKAQELIKSWL